MVHSQIIFSWYHSTLQTSKRSIISDYFLSSIFERIMSLIKIFQLMSLQNFFYQFQYLRKRLYLYIFSHYWNIYWNKRFTVFSNVFVFICGKLIRSKTFVTSNLLSNSSASNYSAHQLFNSSDSAKLVLNHSLTELSKLSRKSWLDLGCWKS